MVAGTKSFQGVALTGIAKLKGKLRSKNVIVGCSGVTFGDYDDNLPPRDWIRVAINEGIRKFSGVADFWVLSDFPIVRDYSKFVTERTTVLAMHEAVTSIHKHCRTAGAIYTVESMQRAEHYPNPYEFHSRGTVMIGAIEMLKYMGATTFYCFGLDCYSEKDRYYYDNRVPPALSEKRIDESTRVSRDLPTSVKIFVTPRLENMIRKLDAVKKAGLWNDIKVWCVNSPLSQQTAIPKMTLDEFKADVAKATKPKPDPTADPPVKRKRGRPRKVRPEEVPHDQEDGKEQVDPVLEQKDQEGKEKEAGDVPVSSGSGPPRAPGSVLQTQGEVTDGKEEKSVEKEG